MSHNYEQHIRTVENFPKPGIDFYDIAPLIGGGAIFGSLIENMAAPLKDKVTKVIAFDARGFIFGAPMAVKLGVGCVMLRKPGKLPGETHTISYDLEYGSNNLEIQTNVIEAGERVVLVDDVIATGGTALAGLELVQKCGAEVVEFCSVIDLLDLGGSERIQEAGVDVRAMVRIGNES